MKKLLMTLILAIMAVPAMAQEHSHDHGGDWLKPVEAQFVCMVNNQSYDTPQIAVEVEGKTYYGCCPMCKDRLANDPAARSAVDPVSGNTVNKAEAVIGAGPDRAVYYFENEENFQKYASGPMPETKHDHMDGMGMGMKGMEGSMMEGHMNMNGQDDGTKKTPEDHESHH